MKTTIGGDRLGSGNKQNVSLRNYERSTHDLSYIWRSSMSAGTLVPFMSKVALPGDSWDINLNCEVLTLPTIGPLFGSYKVQLDVFEVPIRLYNAGLHMNRLGIGMEMNQVFLPKIEVKTNDHNNYVQTFDDNEQINSSSLLKYLGISGLGTMANDEGKNGTRYFNAVPYLAYWDIYKNYYANKQENEAACIHTYKTGITYADDCFIATDEVAQGNIAGNPINITATELTTANIVFDSNEKEPDVNEMKIKINGINYPLKVVFASILWNQSTSTIECSVCKIGLGQNWSWEWDNNVGYPPLGGVGAQLDIKQFKLDGIDKMREDILQLPFDQGAFIIDNVSPEPYNLPLQSIGTNEDLRYSTQFSQEGLALKTYQSDLFNNWIDTEWIDGTNGVNAISAVSTAGDSFTIDALNLASKVYDMLNRVAISGGTYDDWLNAVYTHKRIRGTESPIYHGSLIKELAFEEVISNAETETESAGNQPLGTLAGRGRLTNKNKGGKMVIKVNEPSYIIGIVSLTPRIDYSQGNNWDVNLDTLDDLHKPALDGIGFQDLITEQMWWGDTIIESDGSITQKSAGKQPAWINYMTAVNKTYGNFAEENKDMFMTLNRRYEKNQDGSLADLTTYIDPTKFNHIFAQTELDAQNFWVQISNNITARRKMSAKIIPNL